MLVILLTLIISNRINGNYICFLITFWTIPWIIPNLINYVYWLVIGACPWKIFIYTVGLFFFFPIIGDISVYLSFVKNWRKTDLFSYVYLFLYSMDYLYNDLISIISDDFEYISIHFFSGVIEVIIIVMMTVILIVELHKLRKE